jgi:hypothetical protein
MVGPSWVLTETFGYVVNEDECEADWQSDDDKCAVKKFKRLAGES